jgi:hypothetical protein
MTTKFTHWKQFHQSDYIGAYAFQPGEEKIATIKSVSVEDVPNPQGKKEPCMVVQFTQADLKPLICNVTNSKAIEKVAGSPYIENWAGVSIQLYVTEVSAFGSTVEAVRVRTKAPKVSKPKLTESHPKFDYVVGRLATGEATIETVREHFDISEPVASKLMEQAMHKAEVKQDA